MGESITVTDNRTGTRSRYRSSSAGSARRSSPSSPPGVWFYDPGFEATAACESSITFVDGEAGILRYRGYPIEQLAEKSTYLEVAYLLSAWRAADRDAVRGLGSASHVPHVHPRERAQAVLGGLPLRRAPDGHARVRGRRAVDLLRRRQADPRRRGADRQIVRLIAKMPTLAAAATASASGCRSSTPTTSSLHGQLPLHDVEGRRAPLPGGPRARRALEILFILHADHEQNCGTTAMRVAASAHADPYSATAAATAALYGPRTAGRTRPPSMLTEIGSVENVAAFVDQVKRGNGRLQGFGHRVYKSYDPRATIVKRAAYDVFEVTGKNPLIDIALKLEETALSDDYFIDRKLYPNIDFYTGLIYQAMGFPMEMFTVLFAIPRTVGWLSHFKELLDQDLKIARPRQLYIGQGARDYVSMSDRSGG